MDAIKALKTRRSVRNFTSEVIDNDVLSDLVDCARLAPTAINIQPWEFVVVRDSEKLRTIAEATDYGRFIAEAQACIVVFCRETKYYLEDGSAATQNILLAARAHGLGACWVAGDKKAYAGRICELVNAPKGLNLVSLVPVGFPGESSEKSKRSLDQVIHWEGFES